MRVQRSRHILGRSGKITAVPRSISASAASAQKLQKAYSHNYGGAGARPFWCCSVLHTCPEIEHVLLQLLLIPFAQHDSGQKSIQAMGKPLVGIKANHAYPRYTRHLPLSPQPHKKPSRWPRRIRDHQAEKRRRRAHANLLRCR